MFCLIYITFEVLLTI